MSKRNIIAQIGDPILRQKTLMVDPYKIKSLKVKNIIKIDSRIIAIVRI